MGQLHHVYDIVNSNNTICLDSFIVMWKNEDLILYLSYIFYSSVVPQVLWTLHGSFCLAACMLRFYKYPSPLEFQQGLLPLTLTKILFLKVLESLLWFDYLLEKVCVSASFLKFLLLLTYVTQTMRACNPVYLYFSTFLVSGENVKDFVLFGFYFYFLG